MLGPQNYEIHTVSPAFEERLREDPPGELYAFIRERVVIPPLIDRPPLFDIEGEKNLKSYYEIYDRAYNRTIVLIGELHEFVQVSTDSARPFRGDTMFNHVNNIVLKGLMKDRRMVFSKSLIIERDVEARQELLWGGGPFDVDPDTGKVVFNPTFEPETALNLPRNEYTWEHVMGYLANTAARKGIRTIPFDTRYLFFGSTEYDALARPWLLFGNVHILGDEFSKDAEKMRQDIYIRFLYGICSDLVQKFERDPGLGDLITGPFVDLKDLLRGILEQVAERRDYYQRLIEAGTTAIQLLKYHSAPVTPNHKADLVTLREQSTVLRLTSRLRDLYALRKLLEDPLEGGLVVVYAGASHIDNIAKFLLNHFTGYPDRFVLQHVGYQKKGKLTTRFVRPEDEFWLLKLYSAANILPYQEYIDKTQRIPDTFYYDPLDLVYNDPQLTKACFEHWETERRLESHIVDDI